MTQFHMLCLRTGVITIHVPMVTLAGLIFHLSIMRIGSVASITSAPTLSFTGWIGVSQLQTFLTEEWNIELHCVYEVDAMHYGRVGVNQQHANLKISSRF